MATYDKRININFNRLLDRTALRENWLDFFQNKLAETVAAMFQGKSGTLDADKVGLGASANDTFDLDMTSARKLVVGSGNVITLPTNANRVLKEHLQVPFENSTGTTYEVGIKYQQPSDGIQINGRTGAPEYPRVREDMGELGSPDSVTDNPGVSITLQINTLTQSGIDHSGRKVIVYLTTPVSGVESVAYYEGTVAYSGGNNQVVIPYSGGDGPLGQDTSVNPPSTLATDYVVFLPGASWKAGTGTIYGDSDYAFIGRINGNGPGTTPASFDTGLQDPVFLITLQNAYDGIGSGGGRKILANDGAVNIRSTDSNDDYHALMVLDRKGATEGAALNQVQIIGKDKGLATLAVAPTTKGSNLAEDEGGTSQATTGLVNLTGGTVDLNAAGVRDEADLVLLSGFTTAAMNRLYKISSFTSNSVTLQSLDGTPLSFWSSGETGTVSFFRIRMAIAGEEFVGDEHPHLTRGTVLNGKNYALGPVLRIYPNEDESALDVYDNNATPRRQFRITRDGTLHLETAGSPEDFYNSQLRLSRLGNTDYMQFMLYMEEGDVSSVPIACLKPVQQFGVARQMACSLSGATVTVTGYDVTDYRDRINADMDLILLEDTSPTVGGVAVDDGLYFLDTVGGADNFTVRDLLTGAATSFTATSGKCTILRPTFVNSGSAPSPFGSALNFWKGILFQMTDSNGNNGREFRIMLENSQSRFKIFDASKTTGTTYYPPRELLDVDPSAIGQAHKYPFKFRRGMVVRGGDVSGGTGEESFYWRDGVRIWNAGGGIDDRDPMFAFAVDYGFPEHVPTYHTWPTFAVDTLGGVARGHNFRDDFFYREDTPWVNAWPQPPHYYTYFVGSGNIQARDIYTGAAYGHGCVVLTTGASISDVAELGLSPTAFNLDTGKDFRWLFRARFKPGSITDVIARLGFNRGNVNNRYYFQLTNGTWNFVYWNGSTYVAAAESCSARVDHYQWFEIMVSSSMVFFTVDCKDHAAGNYMSGSVSIPSLNGQAGALGINCWLQTQAAAIKTGVLDYWEVWDIEAIYGRLGNSHNMNHP